MGKGRIVKKRNLLFFAITVLAIVLFCFSVALPQEAEAFAEPDEYTPVITAESKRVYRGPTFVIEVELSDGAREI